MSSHLAAGFGKADITPGRDADLVGYAERRSLHEAGNAGVLDPLFLRLIVFEESGKRLVLISLDLCVLKNAHALALRSLVSNRLTLSPECVTLATTHTHSGPIPTNNDNRISKEPVPLPETRGYFGILKEALEEALEEALINLRPATLKVRESSLGFAYNRRVKVGDAIEMCWSLRQQNHLQPDPAEDPAFVLLEVHREDNDLLLFNLAGHPVVLGKESNHVSADWPGAACRLIQELNPGTEALFFHGAGGDAHPWLATGRNPKDLATVAGPVAGLATLLYRSGGKPEPHAGITSSGRTLSRGETQIILTAWKLGPILCLALPGEVFGRTGRRLRSVTALPLLLMTTANGWDSYWPPRSAYEKNGYEVDVAKRSGITPGWLEAVEAAAIELLLELQSNLQNA